MPIYEFLCKTCNTMIVESKSADDRDNEVLCITCNMPMKRLYSSVGVTFNGNGFYSTDK